MGSLPIKISASRGAAILGLSAWTTQTNIWQQIMEEVYPGFNAENNYTLPEFQESAPLRWGNAFEEAVIKTAEKIQDKKINLREKLYIKGGFISCHIDGRYSDKKLHEGKTTNAYTYREKWGKPGTDKIPREYMLQVQHQMICTGAKECIVSVLVFPNRTDDWEKAGIEIIKNPEFEDSPYFILDKNTNEIFNPPEWALALHQMGYFHQYIVKAHKTAQKTMLKKYKEWWQKHIIEKKQPEQQNYDDIRRLINQPVGTIVAPEKIERLCKELKDLGKEKGTTGRIAKRQEQLKLQILSWIKKNDDFIIDEDSTDKWVLKSEVGGTKLISFDGTTVR